MKRNLCILLQIQGKPIIQQRILPSPAISIDLPQSSRSTAAPGDENSNIIFSPWKAFGPFVDTVQVKYIPNLSRDSIGIFLKVTFIRLT